MVRDGYLSQNAMSEVDASCSLAKQQGMLELLLDYYARGSEALGKGAALDKLLAMPEREELARLREVPEGEFAEAARALGEKVAAAVAALTPAPAPAPTNGKGPAAAEALSAETAKEAPASRGGLA
jgi:vacuolar-type H+-ATPase catalytic subunit A/Vma1